MEGERRATVVEWAPNAKERERASLATWSTCDGGVWEVLGGFRVQCSSLYPLQVGSHSYFPDEFSCA